MKTRILMMVFVVVAVLAPAVQAVVFTAPCQLDSMTFGSILTSNGGRWWDSRGYVPTMVKEELLITHDGDGSMMIDYSQFDTTNWDVDARGDYGRILPANLGPISVGPTDVFKFWSYRPAGGAGGAERIAELQVYSPGGDNRAVATVVRTQLAPCIEVGWTLYTIPRTAFVNDYGVIDWNNIDLVNFWVTCWSDNGIGWWEVPPGSGNWEPMPGYEQYPPTYTPLYIDDFQLVPEPATMSLLGLGALALLKRRKA